MAQTTKIVYGIIGLVNTHMNDEYINNQACPYIICLLRNQKLVFFYYFVVYVDDLNIVRYF